MSSSSMHPTAVNDAVVDSVTRSNTKVLSDAPAMAMGQLYQTVGNSAAIAQQQTLLALQQANVGYQAGSQLGIIPLSTAIIDPHVKAPTDAPAMAMGNLSQAINNALTMAALQTQRAQQGADHALQAASQIAYSKLFNENN
jgi:hypothetical protein